MTHPAPKNIVLIGMPAVGKSTVGVLLAKRLGFGFSDTDLLIQTGEGRRLNQLILDHGVDRFCDLEADYIRCLTLQRTVIATGGSVVYRSVAMDHLAKIGHIIFLDIDAATLTRRLSRLDERGVVRVVGQTFESLYAERHPLYQRYAQDTIACANQTPEQVVQAILATLLRTPLFCDFI